MSATARIHRLAQFAIGDLAAARGSLSDLLCKSGSSRLYVMFTLQELETVWEVYFEDIERFGPSLGAGPSNPSTGG